MKTETQILDVLQKLLEQTETLEAPVATQGSSQERDWPPPYAQME